MDRLLMEIKGVLLLYRAADRQPARAARRDPAICATFERKAMRQPDAAVAIVHTRSAPESVLLMRRSERANDSWSGHWSLPGGRCDPADTSLVHTALRELAEECGVHLTESHLE